MTLPSCDLRIHLLKKKKKNPSLIKFLWFSGIFTGHDIKICTSEPLFNYIFFPASPKFVCGNISCPTSPGGITTCFQQTLFFVLLST